MASNFSKKFQTIRLSKEREEKIRDRREEVRLHGAALILCWITLKVQPLCNKRLQCLIWMSTKKTDVVVHMQTLSSFHLSLAFLHSLLQTLRRFDYRILLQLLLLFQHFKTAKWIFRIKKLCSLFYLCCFLTRSAVYMHCFVERKQRLLSLHSNKIRFCYEDECGNICLSLYKLPCLYRYNVKWHCKFINYFVPTFLDQWFWKRHWKHSFHVLLRWPLLFGKNLIALPSKTV